MKTKHTPGSWRVCAYYPNLIKVDAPGRTICTITRPSQSITWEDKEAQRIVKQTEQANARLIAAAPELLAALNALVGAFDGDVECTEILNMIKDDKGAIRSAIAKATDE